MEEVEQEPTAEEPRWWSVLNAPLVAMVIAVLLYAAAAAGGIIVSSLLPSLPVPAATSVLNDGIILAFVLSTYKLMIVHLGERPRDDLGANGSLPDLGKGIVAGLAIFSAIVGVAAALGIYIVIGWGDASGMLVALVSVAVVPAFTEEILFRGILFRWIEEFAGSWTGLAVSSLAFGFAHILNPGADVVACLWIAIEAGLLLGGAYMLTRSLWMPVGLHAAWNFAEGPMFGVPVSGGPSPGLIRAYVAGPPILSGGPFGLEASIIALVIATAAGVLFVSLAVRRGELKRPSWVRRRLALTATPTEQ